MSTTSMSTPARRRLSMTAQILIAMGAGFALGLLLNLTGLAGQALVKTWLLDGVLKVVGELFKNALLMMTLPLIFVSLACGVGSLKEPAQLGRIGGKTLAFYLFSTIFSISFALLLAAIVQPGAGVDMGAGQALNIQAPPSLVAQLSTMIPPNPVAAFASGNVLQVLIFALLFGLAVVLSGEAGRPVESFLTSLNEVVMRLVGIVMAVAPYGVFALLTIAIAQLGLTQIAALGKYFVLVLVLLLFHLFVTYPLALKFIGGLNPMMWIRKMRPVLLFAFSTSSSNATIPVTLKTTERALGVSNRVASFTIPLGATINMNGTSIMQGVATLFIAQAYGVELTLLQLATVVGMATLASVGTAGVPGVGLIMLSMVLTQVGLPVEAIGVIMGIDRLLDMTRTAVNVSGDVAVSCIIAKQEGELDLARYHDPEASAEDTRA